MMSIIETMWAKNLKDKHATGIFFVYLSQTLGVFGYPIPSFRIGTRVKISPKLGIGYPNSI